MHNLFGERFAEAQGGTRERAWHHLGQTFETELTAVEALKTANMGYTLRKLPMLVDLTKRNEDGSLYVNAKGESAPLRAVKVPEMFGIVRSPVAEDPEPRVLGTVGKNYTLLQNVDLARMIDKVPGWHVETVGALGQGETIFFAMATGCYDINGDEIRQYVVVSDQRDGKGGTVFMASNVRVVCQNTYDMALQGASNKVSLTHSSALAAETAELLLIFSQLQKIQNDGRAGIQALAATSVNDVTAKALIEAVYPDPQMPAKVKIALSVDGAVETPALLKGHKAWENSKEVVVGWRDKTFDLWERFNGEFPRSAGTGYALYNAVTEHEDHYRAGRSDRTRAEAVLFGDRALLKGRAFNLLMDLAK